MRIIAGFDNDNISVDRQINFYTTPSQNTRFHPNDSPRRYPPPTLSSPLHAQHILAYYARLKADRFSNGKELSLKVEELVRPSHILL